ncbi:MAG: DUF808 domain-containing protein [Bdellovibrionaceae bacterium]|nr:DUF808 domain-containing protein [Pseudobdellovibrionaceae bacterium]
MPAGSLLALLDDIATTLDDVAVMTKVAAKKTAGVLGDDLAVNAEQVTGVASEREIPIVLAVAKGSAINKAILVPAALAVSQLLPIAVQPLLMLGGAYLCFEGFEKVFEKLFHRASKHEAQPLDVVPVDEKEKIKGAVRTDFILSAEIIVISLGTVAAESLARQFSVLVGISVVMTLGVYGFVAVIVKLDDAGFYFARKPQAFFKALGRGLLAFAPKLMRFLGIAGTIAMFLVGGGILAHGVPALHHLEESLGSFAMALQLGLGVLIGGAVFAVVHVVQHFKRRGTSPAA